MKIFDCIINVIRCSSPNCCENVYVDDDDRVELLTCIVPSVKVEGS